MPGSLGGCGQAAHHHPDSCIYTPRPRPLVSEWTQDRSSVPLGGMGGMGVGAGAIPALLTLGPLRGTCPGG